MTEEDICKTIKSELGMLSAVKDVTATQLPPTNTVQGLVIVDPLEITNIHTFANLLSGFVSVKNFKIIEEENDELTRNTVFQIPKEYSQSSKQVVYEYVYKTNQMDWASN